MFEDDETLRMYIEESLDHLEDIESDLLTIEEGGDNVDVDLVNNVFRAAHSIKGGAGFMGLATIKELAHRLENVLGLVRSLELTPDSDKISVLLKGFDRLENLLKNAEASNEEDVSSHISELERITQTSLPEEKQEMVYRLVDIKLPHGRIFPQVSLYEMDTKKDKGEHLYLVEYDLINDIQRRDKNPLQVIRNLEKTGTILDSRIDFEAVGTLEETPSFNRIPFQILFSSIIESDMTTTLFELDEKYIHPVSDDMLLRPEAAAVETSASAAPADVSETARPTGKTAETQPVKETAEAAAADEKQTAGPETQEETGAKGKETFQPDTAAQSKIQSSLRINVNLLDTLMTLAGELVLSRNQLLQGISSSNTKATEQSSQRIDMITSELQEAIMKTRMQPIANIFNKFTRVVRDLSRDLGKSIDLDIKGKEVELDKTILESVNDPLTHLVRNAVDHGIETPAQREEVGKTPTGKILLEAYHDAGQVNIVISDDGRGIDPEKMAKTAVSKNLISEKQASQMSAKEKTELIFKPGFSTAEAVTDVSGRGVGMDVVVTNIQNLGGIIELDSQPGKGSVVQIKLPLTLAIIPSQITAVGDERYAIPQVNIDELLRIPAAQIKTRVEKVGDANVVRLRGELLPLLDLASLIGIEKSFVNPEDDKIYPDRRKNIADRRSRQLENTPPPEESPDTATGEAPEADAVLERKGGDRRYRAQSALNIAVVSAGSFKYGLIVDRLLDSEEIVVKPVGRHLKKCDAYAGATIMGDGRVALILDIANLAHTANLSAISEKPALKKKAEKHEEAGKDKAALITFRNAETEHFAAPLNLVERIERIRTSSIEIVSNRKVVQYRGGTLPLYKLSQAADVQSVPEREFHEVIVFKVKERELGLIVTPPVDAMEVVLDVDESTLKQPCISGSMIINERTTLLIDIFEFTRQMNPNWFEQDEQTRTRIQEQGEEKTILFAEDSAFFRNQVKYFMKEDGFTVLEAEDGEIAWELLKERSDQIDIVVTDLEMPNMDGFELTKRIKNDPKFGHLSVIALTSLASDAHVQKGREVGIDEYEIKLDREKLMKIVKQHLHLL